MRTIALLVVLLAPVLAAANPDPDADPKRRERILRMFEIVDALDVDETTAGRLVPVISSYAKDYEKLAVQRQAAELQLVTTVGAPPKLVDALLDQVMVSQGAMIANEARLVGKLRKILAPEKAALARVMLVGPVTRAARPSAKAVQCDPFLSMHGCRLPF
jgi:hypothetical protein